MNHFDTSAWEKSPREQAERALRSNASLRDTARLPCRLSLALLSQNNAVADGWSAYLVGDAYVLLVSSARFPESSAHEAEKMQDMQAHLGPQTGCVVFDVVGQGRANGRSFLIVFRCKLLSQGWIMRCVGCWRVRGVVLQWPRELSAPLIHRHTLFAMYAS